MDPKMIIDHADVQLKGFTIEELKDILGYIRTVEAHREDRLVYMRLDRPKNSVDDLKKIMLEIWPDEGGPKTMVIFRKMIP